MNKKSMAPTLPDATVGAPFVEAPLAEQERVAELKSFDVLDTPCEESFDRITRIAQAAIGTPIVLISLVDEQRQWFKARVGLDATETARDISFCTHAIQESAIFVVEDAMKDPRFSSNPLVTGDPNIRFYAGAPLETVGGHRVGTLCAIGREPRSLSADESKTLADLAAMVVHELELRKVASFDVLTGVNSRRNFFSLAEKELNRARRYDTTLSVLMMDLDDFKIINDTHGHAVGDMVLKDAADRFQQILRSHDIIGRMGGEEFAALLPQTDAKGALQGAERIRESMEGLSLTVKGKTIKCTTSIGVCTPESLRGTMKSMIERADVALYEAKHNGRNRVAVAV